MHESRITSITTSDIGHVPHPTAVLLGSGKWQAAPSMLLPPLAFYTFHQCLTHRSRCSPFLCHTRDARAYHTSHQCHLTSTSSCSPLPCLTGTQLVAASLHTPCLNTPVFYTSHQGLTDRPQCSPFLCSTGTQRLVASLQGLLSALLPSLTSIAQPHQEDTPADTLAALITLRNGEEPEAPQAVSDVTEAAGVRAGYAAQLSIAALTHLAQNCAASGANAMVEAPAAVTAALLPFDLKLVVRCAEVRP